MLAACLEVPTGDPEWSMWAWSAKNQIDLIRQAINQKYGVNLTEYILYPFTPTDMWLQNYASAHSDFNGVLGLQGHDLESVDFNDPNEVSAWIDLAYKELYDASAALDL